MIGTALILPWILAAVTCFYENSAYTSAPTCQDVLCCVAHHYTLSQIQTVFGGGKQNHAWIWFSAVTGTFEFFDRRVRVMRAKIECVHVCTVSPESPIEQFVHVRDIRKRRDPSRYHRLIGDDNNLNAIPVQHANCFSGTREQPHLLRIMQ